MEARKEQMEKEKHEDKEEDEMGKAREIIRDTIITKAPITSSDDDNKKQAAEEDVLAYSRAVHQTDSSLD